MSSALNNNLLSNANRVYPGAIDVGSFDASKYGSNVPEVNNNYYGKGGKKSKKSRKPKTRKTYKRGRVGKGRRTRGRKC
jgi:hypothetical protein